MLGVEGMTGWYKLSMQTQTGLELMMTLLPQSPKDEDYKHPLM